MLNVLLGVGVVLGGWLGVRGVRRRQPVLVIVGVVVIGAAFVATNSLRGSVAPGSTAATSTAASPKGAALACMDIERARRDFDIEVVDYSPAKYGVEFPYSDRIVLRITNNSDLVLPYLTALINRYDASGEHIGGARAPSIAVASVAPGDTVEVEHYFRGWLPTASRATVTVEDVIAPDVREFFDELQGCTP